MRVIPARLRNAGSWAWHAATCIETVTVAVLWALAFGQLHEDRVMEVVLCAALLAFSVAWKAERRRGFRSRRELQHTQDNARWLQDQLHERTGELRQLSQVPPPQPPRLATLTVQSPRAFGPRPDDESEWPAIPLCIHADSPHDPAATVVTVRLPASAPWHTES